MDWPSLSDWGNWASLVGVVVASVGLAIVGYQVTGAKRGGRPDKEGHSGRAHLWER